MGLFDLFAAWPRPLLEPEWMQPLPPRLAGARTERPRALVAGPLVVAWGEGLVVAFEVESGRLAYRAKTRPWRDAGFDEAGRLVLARGNGRTALLDPETGGVVDEPGAAAAPERSACDAPDEPGLDPTLRVGDRVYRVAAQTRSRVTRHWIEICDSGVAPQRLEVASFTLRSNRFVLADCGGGRVYGWVGMDPECPAGAVVGGAEGPLLVLRRRFPAWHEHGIPVDEPDLIGHGPAHLGVSIVVPGSRGPLGRELGTAPETWVGLGMRGGDPPYLTQALGARPIGLAGGRVLVELAHVNGDSRGELVPRQRWIAAFGAADLLS